MNELPQPKPTTKFVKALFYNLCLAYGYEDNNLQELSDIAKVHKSVVDAMFVSVAVKRTDAEKVLGAFSERTGKTWNFDTLKVATLPTFADLYVKHHFDLAPLSTAAGVSFAVLDRMLSGHAVSSQDARLVLQMASHLMGEYWNLETVDVPLIDEKGETDE